MTESADDSIHHETSEPIHSMSASIQQAAIKLKSTGDNGATWFYWIAGLSLLNTVMIHGGANLQFLGGLAITTIVDLIANEIGNQNPDLATMFMAIAIGISVFVSMVVALFGWLSRKRVLWIFGIGIFLYVCDGLLCLLIADYYAAGFHVFALFSMIPGFLAYRKLTQLEDALTNSATDDSLADHGVEPA